MLDWREVPKIELRYIRLAVGRAAASRRPARADAFEPKPLPGFEVTALDGLLVRSERLPRPGTWILIYVQENCFPCDALLDLLQDPQASVPAAKVVVVARGTVGEVGRLAGRFPHLGEAAWYADTAGEASEQLRLAGAPVVLGLRGTTVEWTLGGLLPSAVEMRSILATWAAR